ncbi:MAG: YncE family protein [Bacteroidota bacterium]|nr:YncE family protein [Bacteroidota bacterium]
MRPSIIILFSTLLLAAGYMPAHAQPYRPFTLDKTIPLPGNGGYDYLCFDQGSDRLFVSHGTTVDVIDVRTGQLAGSIGGMTGVHGIAIASGLGRGFISDGKGNSVVAFDLVTMKTLKTIPITGKDPDAILYDPFTRRVFTFDGDSQDASVIDAATLTQVGSISLGGTPEFAVSNGQGLVYNNVEDKNVMNVIDAASLKILHSFPLSPCGGPTGLALDKTNQRLFAVCRQNKGMTVLDANTGKVITTVPIGAGVDAVVYDPGEGLIYCSNGDGTATVIRQQSADQYAVVQTLSTSYRAKTMAFDATARRLYFSASDLKEDKKTRIPDTFKVLVYKQP